MDRLHGCSTVEIVFLFYLYISGDNLYIAQL